MKKPILKFLAIQIVVNNLDESMYFYKRIGFFIENIDETENYRFADIKLSHNSDFVIHLMEYFESDESIPKLSIGIGADEKLGNTYEEAYESLLMSGIRFSDIASFELDMIKMNGGEILDPDGHNLTLVNQRAE